MFRARPAKDVHERGEIAHFVPARVDRSGAEPEVTALDWHGSGDIVTVAQANAFLMVPAEKLDRSAGEWAMVLLRSEPGGQ